MWFRRGHPGLPKPDLPKHEVARIAECGISQVTRIAERKKINFCWFVVICLKLVLEFSKTTYHVTFDFRCKQQFRLGVGRWANSTAIV